MGLVGGLLSGIKVRYLFISLYVNVATTQKISNSLGQDVRCYATSTVHFGGSKLDFVFNKLVRTSLQLCIFVSRIGLFGFVLNNPVLTGITNLFSIVCRITRQQHKILLMYFCYERIMSNKDNTNKSSKENQNFINLIDILLLSVRLGMKLWIMDFIVDR